jgi:hypothetical protein
LVRVPKLTRLLRSSKRRNVEDDLPEDAKKSEMAA